jgi:polysaccharide deacetylase 2 family uncharacterized protein YibQ
MLARLCRRALLLACACSIHVSIGAEVQPRIAIIIDDLGYEQRAGERAISLPGPVAYAVLPGAPRAAQLARMAHSRGKEVLLHLPLQAETDPHGAETGDLLLDMSMQQFRRAVGAHIEAVPHITGINTHRGSLLTRHPGHMRWLMDEISDHGNLIFVDSYTSAHSVALRIAREQGIDAARRDVFLDPDRDPDTVAREFARLKQIASRRGFAIGIGHPYPATLDFLAGALPALQADGIELIGIRDLVALTGGERATAAAAE